jgi:N-methylhydantoinase A
MESLINIDNGATLTDICVWDGTEFTFTKTLATPFDLSQCLFDGITKASAEIYGRPALSELLHSTKHIRYSTTQGTTSRVAKSVALNTYRRVPAVGTKVPALSRRRTAWATC